MSKGRRLRADKARVERKPGAMVPDYVSAYDGFTYVDLEDSATGRSQPARVHELVAEAFNGPTPAGMEVYHLDGDRRNNRLDNLGYRPTGSGA